MLGWILRDRTGLSPDAHDSTVADERCWATVRRQNHRGEWLDQACNDPGEGPLGLCVFHRGELL